MPSAGTGWAFIEQHRGESLMSVLRSALTCSCSGLDALTMRSVHQGGSFRFNLQAGCKE